MIFNGEQLQLTDVKKKRRFKNSEGFSIKWENEQWEFASPCSLEKAAKHLIFQNFIHPKELAKRMED